MSERADAALDRAQEALELNAATLLGQILFEFSRLDKALGLCVVWADSSQRLIELNKQAVLLPFPKRLELLSQLVESSLARNSEPYQAYNAWIDRAHAAHGVRNRLVHGRWGVDATQGYAINVVGLPTTPRQQESKYTLAELEGIRNELAQLQASLYTLRNHWPL